MGPGPTRSSKGPAMPSDRRRQRSCWPALCAGLLALLGVAGGAAGQTADLSGRQVSIAIGYGTGGSFYAYARLFADHLGRFLPGKPTVIVQSMPGAGGVRMLNTAARLMPGDGTQLFVPPDTLVITQLTAREGVQFDARRFHYLGSANQQNQFLAVRRTAAASLAELKLREATMGHSGAGSAGHYISALARETLGSRIRPIFEGVKCWTCWSISGST